LVWSNRLRRQDSIVHGRWLDRGMPVARNQVLVKNGHPTRLWRLRNKQRELNKGPTRRLAEFVSARSQLTVRLCKIDSIADRLPLIVMSIKTEKQLLELVWYLAVETRRALARCSHAHRCQLGLFGTSRGLPDWRDCVYRGVYCSVCQL
jgi:hypothetical protein